MVFKYNPDTDIPDLSGKVFLVTGGTAGVGKEAIIQLAKHSPKHIYFTGRNQKAADALVSEIKPFSSDLTFIPMDQTSLSSVSAGAKSFLEKSDNELDVLICNAGVMAVPPGTSKDGYEIQFAVNHLAHALLIKLCLPALEKAKREKGDARIVSVTSLAFKSPPKHGIEFKDLKTDMHASLGWTTKWMCYGQSKLANILFASQLAVHHPGITTIAIHPGVIFNTSLGNHLSMLDKVIIRGATLNLTRITLKEGGYNTLWAATIKGDERVMKTGGVYEPVGKPVIPTKLSADEGLQKELWEWTEKELAAYN
ncbi:related to oxidoreductase, short-chain dehydrogenase/reductase family [Phialocephala subalpina]|uniref:Related to oxidoreductase, short-chain dehydrogenase/reductase family n=1 Tax=Phialocephala subalpina TaxID=576137 RepID=A0A1L7X2V8_9HELO|nr:related to oxidoreductase, short-chain dehydrogenase/reductase family [Phialocephala subalpina]